MADAPLSPSERDLAAIAGQHARDGFLVDLVNLADDGLGMSIGLLLNGMFVFGNLDSPRAFAEQIDVQRQLMVSRATEPPEGKSEEEWAEQGEQFARQNTRAVDMYDEERRELDQNLAAAGGDGSIDWDQAPGDLTRRVIAHNARTSLTLSDVQIIPPSPQGIVRVPVLRVALSQIAAWWVVQLDESGQASFQLFEQPDQ